MQQAVSKIRVWSQKIKPYWYLIILIAILSLTLIYFISASINTKGDDEWSNNATLIAELGVGVIITVVVVAMARVHQHEIDRKISNVLDIVKAEEEIKKAKKNEIYTRIILTLKKIRGEISAMQDNVESYNDMKNRTDRNMIKRRIMLGHNKIEEFSKNELDDQRDLSLDFFDSDSLKMIEGISKRCKNRSEFNKHDKKIIRSSFVVLKHKIDFSIAELKEKT